MKEDLNARYQTMLILWFALLMSVVSFLLFGLFAGFEQPEYNIDSALEIAFGAVAGFMVVLSFVIKGRLLERSVENQDAGLVQTALVVACAMCEVSALLGFVMLFVFNSRSSFLLFIMAAAGIALHFPRRSQLAAATYKQNSEKSF